MGFALSWIAMKGATADEACVAQGLVRCGGEFDSPETTYAGAVLPTGWYLTVGNSDAINFFWGEDMAALSRIRDSVVFSVEDHVMQYAVAYWRDGACVWSVIHDAQEGVYHLDVEGEPPAEFESLRAEFFGKQDDEGGEDADVDYICEIPTTLARRITGYQHDFLKVDGQKIRFEELEEADELPDVPDGWAIGDDDGGSNGSEQGTERPEPSRLERFLLKYFGR